MAKTFRKSIGQSISEVVHAIGEKQVNNLISDGFSCYGTPQFFQGDGEFHWMMIKFNHPEPYEPEDQ